MSMSLTNRVSTAGHFELLIDSHPTSAYLKSVDGGHVKTQVMDEAIGGDNHHVKHVSVVEIEPISVELGLAGSRNILTWIQDSWLKRYTRRSGCIMHADFDLIPVFEHEFSDALVVETTFPTLDGTSKDPGYLKVKLLPEQISMHRPTTKERIKGTFGTKQKQWTNRAFRVVIDGIPEMQYVNKLESFTVKQGVKKLYNGVDRFPQIEPTKLEFPTLSGTLGLAHCNALLSWHDQTNMVGSADPKVQREGAIEYLGPAGQVLFRLKLSEVGLNGLQVSASTANANEIKRAKFELYVGRMEIDSTDGLE